MWIKDKLKSICYILIMEPFRFTFIESNFKKRNNLMI